MKHPNSNNRNYSGCESDVNPKILEKAKVSDHQPSFITLPYHIFYMDGIQLSYLKVYEVIFQFWHRKNAVFASNSYLAQRTGLAERTIKNALEFFESHGELKRVQKGNKRYLVQPTKVLEIELSTESVDNSIKNCTKSSQGGANLPGGGEPTCPGGGANLPYNNNKLNKSFKINKSFSASPNDQKQNTPTTYVNRDTMTEECKTKKRGSLQTAEKHLAVILGNLKPSAKQTE